MTNLPAPFAPLVSGGEGLDRYPSGTAALATRMAEVYSVPAEQVLPVRGATHGFELIFRLALREQLDVQAPGAEPFTTLAGIYPTPVEPAGVIRIWGCLGAANEEFDLLLDHLTGQEQERAKGYRFPKDRLRFIRARVFLRHLLAGHLGELPKMADQK